VGVECEDWAEIRQLHRAERMPVKVIARVLGCSKNMVKKALAAEGPAADRRQARGSVVDPVEPRIRELLQACPTMPATVNGLPGRTRSARGAGGWPRANPFFQLVSRYERASLIVTSNKPFGRWGEVFGDEVVAAAMIDRLIHHAEVVSLRGDSYRLKTSAA
jgi:hypothetical protein